MAIKKRKLNSGATRYEVTVVTGYAKVTNEDGSTRKVRREHSRTFATRAEARGYWVEQQRNVDTGRFVEPCLMPLGEWLDKWLDGPVQLKVRARTLKGYRKGVTVLKRQPIASVPLGHLTTGALEDFYTALALTGTTGKRGLRPASIRGIHVLIHLALRKAVKDRLLLANPAAGAELPGRKAEHDPRTVGEDGPSFHALSRDQVRALLEESAKPPAKREGIRKNKKRWSYTPPGDQNRHHAFWHLLINGGLRPSEAQALKWEDDIDWKRGRVRITKALVESLGRGESWRLEPPKTERGRRTIELPPETMAALRRHMGQQEIEKIAAGTAYQDHGFVFAGPLGTPLDLRNAKQRHFHPLLEAAKLPRIRVYDLRHTHCTLLLGAGVPVHVVSQRMGHASAKMTLDVYANYLPEQHEEAMTRYRAYVEE